ncbi:MAG: zinc dependent phospholipase C family protein [Bacillota bacterium]
MPNLISHYYFAKKVKDSLPQDVAEITEKYPDSYFLGAIGPDFLFVFRELGFKEKMYPNTMQFLKMYEVFEGCLDKMRKSYNEEQMSYILGLLCHYCSDFCLHPYVNYFVENHFAKHLPTNQISSIHALIESGIDSHICEDKFNIAPNAFKAHKACGSKKKTRLAIGKLYYDIINPIFGYDTKPKRLSLAFTITKLFMLISVDKWKIKKELFSKIEDIVGGKKKLTGLFRPPEGYKEIDYMNFDKREWLKVRNESEKTNENVYEAFDRAEKHAIEYIGDFMGKLKSGKPLDRRKFTINYEGVKVY